MQDTIKISTNDNEEIMKEKNLFTRNGKLKQASAYTVNFGIPALKTCPMAEQCKDFCYANKGAYAWPVVKAAYERRLKATRSKDFVYNSVLELSKKKKLEAVRIHDSGDFYNTKYLDKWIQIANNLPDKIFYFYTKQVVMLKNYQATGKLPKNMRVIYSLGGREDKHIDMKKDRHSKIFMTMNALKKAGYVDATKNDSVAWQSRTNRIGLVIH
jgi:hypothetical protein